MRLSRKNYERKVKHRITMLADRLAVLMVLYWSKYGEGSPEDRPFNPLDDDIFWLSSDANELRAMPEYQKAINTIREML